MIKESDLIIKSYYDDEDGGERFSLEYDIFGYDFLVEEDLSDGGKIAVKSSYIADALYQFNKELNKLH